MRQRRSQRPRTAFFGGREDAGGFDALQAEKARIPYAVKLPEEVSDDQAILISDIFPTGYQAADIAEIRDGDVVCVFGCGPVGQLAIWSAKHAGRRRSRRVSAYEEFDRRRPGWLKVALDPSAVTAGA